MNRDNGKKAENTPLAVRSGTLYVVATPLGNLEDLAPRAQRVLAEVELILAEDTRRSRKLLVRYGIRTPLSSFHEHNQRQRLARILQRLAAGDSLALVSDAGTPLLSDPGLPLVRKAREQGIVVAAVPGPCAISAALSVAGLPADRFRFAGFPPARQAARRGWLTTLRDDPDTLVFFEAPHRLPAFLADAAECLGASREAVLLKELSKLHEQARHGSLEALRRWLEEGGPERKRGEFVIVVAGLGAPAAQREEARRVLRLLSDQLPRREAVRLATEITGVPRNILYRLSLEQDPTR